MDSEKQTDMSESKCAKWQRTHRKKMRELGYMPISHWVPAQYKELIKKILSFITPLPHTNYGNTLFMMDKMIELSRDEKKMIVHKDIRGWHIEIIDE